MKNKIGRYIIDEIDGVIYSTDSLFWCQFFGMEEWNRKHRQEYPR